VDRFRYAKAKLEAEPVIQAVQRVAKGFAQEVKETYSKLPEISFLTEAHTREATATTARDAAV
jgi:hypothetical protein